MKGGKLLGNFYQVLLFEVYIWALHHLFYNDVYIPIATLPACRNIPRRQERCIRNYIWEDLGYPEMRA